MNIMRIMGPGLLMALWLTMGVCSGGGLAEKTYYQAVEQGMQGNFSQAQETLVQALRADPFYAPAKVCLETLQDVTTKKIKPQTAIHVFTAMAYGNHSQWEEFIAEINRALQLDPEYGAAYNHRGNAFDESGQYDRAVADYDRALKLNPQSWAAYLNRGVANGKRGDADQAVIDYTLALKLNPQLPLAHYVRGNAYARRGELDKAVADFDQAVALNPSFAEAHFNKAMACERAGRPQDAAAAYRSFLHYAAPEFTHQIQHAREKIGALAQNSPVRPAQSARAAAVSPR